MVRRSSRSRSRGRPDVYQAGEVKTPERKKVASKKEKPAPEEKKMGFEAGDTVMAKWPGSKLYYNAKIQIVRAESNEYDVEFENGIVFTVIAKEVYKQSSGSLRKAVTSRKSKSRARSTGRGKKTKVISINQDSEEESINVSNSNKSVGFEEPLENLLKEGIVAFNDSRTSAKGSNSSKVSKKASSSSRISKKNSSSSKIPQEILSSDLTEDEETAEPVRASNSSRRSRKTSNNSQISQKLSNSSRRSAIAVEVDENEVEDISSEEDEPPVTRSASRRSASSKIIENGNEVLPERLSGSSRISSAPITDVYSDDEELVSVSGRPSGSSQVSKKMSVSSRISTLLSGNSESGGSNKPSQSSTTSKKMSFSSMISKIVGGVTTPEETVNVEIEQNSENEEITKKVSVSSQKSGKISKSSVKNNSIELSDDSEVIEEEVESAEVFSPRRSSRISARPSNSTNVSKVTNNSLRLDEYSEDELDESKADAAADTCTAVNKEGSWSFEWVWAILFMFLCPAILITLHTICTGNGKSWDLKN